MKVYLITLVIACNNSIINKKGNKNHENIHQKEVHVNYSLVKCILTWHKPIVKTIPKEYDEIVIE